MFTAIFIAARIFTLLLVSSLLTYTTSPTDLTDAIEKLLSPLKVFKIEVHTFAMMMTIALRFIPILVDEIFDIIRKISSTGTTILLVEQNAFKALSIANRAYILETGSIAKTGNASDLAKDDSVIKAYLGG